MSATGSRRSSLHCVLVLAGAGPMLLTAWLGAARPLAAQPAESSPLQGSVAIGVRSVDIDGAATKFREDINLDDGARLFDLSLRYRPTGENGGSVDEIALDASGLGGDPFESIHFGVRKFGAYRLKVDRRRSAYFYQDTILPVALASVNASNGGDFHRFDFERVRDTATLDIDLTPATRLSFGLEHQTRAGDSTTTLDIQRDEFELEKPLDESLDRFRVGVQHRFEKLTLIVEESLAAFDNTSEIFLPGASGGASATNPAELQFFLFDQTYDYDSREHLVRIIADPTDRLNVRAMLRSEDLDLDTALDETSSGTSFTGAPFTADLTGSGGAARDLDTAQVDIGYRIGAKTRLIGGLRSSGLDQSGASSFGSALGQGLWDVDTRGFRIGAEHEIRPGLLIAGGWSNESREASSRWQLDAHGHALVVDTDRDGFFTRLLFRGDAGLELTASIENNDIDDPFTLSSPTGSVRYRAGIRRAFDSGLFVNGSYRRTDVENDASGWAADTAQADVRVGYRNGRLDFSGGIGDIDVEREILQTVTGGTRQETFPIAYAADSTFTDVTARWLIGDRISLGGRVADYTNRGSVRLDRQDLIAELGIRLTGDYLLELRYRDVDYTEDSFDSYDAELLEIGLRLDW